MVSPSINPQNPKPRLSFVLHSVGNFNTCSPRNSRNLTRMRRPKSKKFRFQKRQAEVDEIDFLESWIDSGKPDSGFNPLWSEPLTHKAPIGRLQDGSFSRYVGSVKFSQLPLSKKTKDGLAGAKYKDMTDIQRASLPHSLCGRHILGAAKTGSGKTLAFVIPVLEKLYKTRWGPEDGVGAIILSPTRELAGQIFDVLKSVGKYHNFSAGLLIGGRKEVNIEKEHVNNLNILVCTPGRLLQHMHETENFDCSQLQILVLDEADRVLDEKFKKDLDALISQLPKCRQTLLFSATQTKFVPDLIRLSLKDPEYLSVHEESATATPDHLVQTAMLVPLDKKLDMLWSFIKAHLNSRILVFLSSRKQVRFVFEAFKKLRPGIPLKWFIGKMKQDKRMGMSEFSEKRCVLFATDVASRGLDFRKTVDWVVQVDCPDDVATYIHRVGRTARFMSGGRSLLFLAPSEVGMLKKLQDKKIPIEFTKVNTKRLQPVSGLLAALIVKYPDLQTLAQRAFITYLKSVHKKQDKEVFDVMKLPIDEFSASLGLPMTPKIRFLKQKIKGKDSIELSLPQVSNVKGNFLESNVNVIDKKKFEDEVETEVGKEILLPKDTFTGEKETEIADPGNGTRILKKKKLKINVHRPVGTRFVFDEEGNTLPPLAKLAGVKSIPDLVQLDKDKIKLRYEELRSQLKQVDVEDKALDRQRRKEKRIKDKMKWKKERSEDETDIESEGDVDVDEGGGRVNKKAKLYFNSESDNEGTREEEEIRGVGGASMSIAEQEQLALKLLSSMHS